MNILYLNDPNCVHGFKWMSYFSNQPEKYKCVLIGQQHQDKKLPESTKDKLSENHVKYLEPVFEFSVSHFLRTFQDFQYIKKVVEENKIDLIHIMYAEPSVMWALGRNYFGIPMILTTRGTDVLVTIPKIIEKPSVFNRILKTLFFHAFQNLDFITSTSTRQKEMVKKFLNGANKTTTVLRTGVNLEKLQSDTSQFLPIDLKGLKFIFFPRYMNTLYNHDFSLDAIQLLPDEIKSEYKMVFLNADGPARGYIASIKKRMAGMNDVDFIFFNELKQTSLFEIYKKASLIVMNPLSDGAPVSALEAMDCHTPVILGPLEYDKDLFDGTVWQFKQWEPKELADLMTDILIKLPKEDINKVLEKAYETVNEKANTLKEVQKLENIYHDLVKKE